MSVLLQMNEPDFESIPEPFTVMLVGPPGSGKTTLAAGFGCLGQHRVHFLDIDHKFQQIAAELHERYPDYQLTYQQFDTTMYGKKGIDFSFANQKKPELGLPAGANPKAYTQVVNLINELYGMDEFPFDTLVIDSFTRLFEHLLAKVRKLQGHGTITENDWNLVLQNALQFAGGIIGLPCNIVVNCHQKPQINQNTHQVEKITPDIQGQFVNKFPGFFQEVWHLRPNVQGNVTNIEVITHSTGLIDARSSFTRVSKVPADPKRILNREFMVVPEKPKEVKAKLELKNK